MAAQNTDQESMARPLDQINDPLNNETGNKQGRGQRSALALAFLLVGVCLAAFTVALDRAIVATAIPRITDDFDSPNDVGWYGSA